MYKKIVFLVLILASQNVFSADAPNTSADPRELVTMPEVTRNLMRQEMVKNLSAINQIIAFLADNKLEEAAEVSEIKMGRSTIGKFRGTGIGPGRYMPAEMKNIARALHEAASEFSISAKQGDVQSTYSALQKVTSACVACHSRYRIR